MGSRNSAEAAQRAEVSAGPGREAHERASLRAPGGFTRLPRVGGARWACNAVIGSVGAGAGGVGVAETSARSHSRTCFRASAARRMASSPGPRVGSGLGIVLRDGQAHSASISISMASAWRSSGGPPPMRAAAPRGGRGWKRHRELALMRRRAGAPRRSRLMRGNSRAGNGMRANLLLAIARHAIRLIL